MSEYEVNPIFERAKYIGRKDGIVEERYRIVKLLIELGAIRRDAFGDLVAMDTNGQNCIYLTGLEPNNIQGVKSGTSTGSDTE